jgi:hypothetical protein
MFKYQECFHNFQTEEEFEESKANFYKFMTVRHPLERLVSFLHLKLLYRKAPDIKYR